MKLLKLPIYIIYLPVIGVMYLLLLATLPLYRTEKFAWVHVWILYPFMKLRVLVEGPYVEPS